MNWTVFLDWFFQIAKAKQLFEDRSKPRIYLINADLITHIKTKEGAKKKTGKKKKITSIPIKEFISKLMNIKGMKVIIISERPYKYYKFIVKPVFYGPILDYTNPLTVASVIMSETKKIATKAMFSYGRFYDPLVTIIQTQAYSIPSDFEPERDIDHLLQIYYKIRFEAKTESIQRFLYFAFSILQKRRLSLPSEFFQTIKYVKPNFRFISDL
jgi:hypothetical protein